MVCGEVFKKPIGYRGAVHPFGARFRYYIPLFMPVNMNKRWGFACLNLYTKRKVP